jgi:hypothetical protein
LISSRLPAVQSFSSFVLQVLGIYAEFGKATPRKMVHAHHLPALAF